MKEIQSREDVFNHFGVDSNAELERSMYKYTSCGAWAEVGTEDAFDNKEAAWTAKYVRCQGEWSLAEIKDASGKPCPQVPVEVQDYFWPNFENLQEELERVLDTKGMEAEYTAEIKWREITGIREVFRVGSIVEGTDAEAETRYVYLPCKAEDLDAAVQAVEDDAELIWNQTHGCEECAKRNGWEWPGCSVDEECPSCDGYGVVI